MERRIKVIYEDGYPENFEDSVYQFINQKVIKVIDIKYSHSEIMEDNSRHSSTSFSAMIIYKEKTHKIQ